MGRWFAANEFDVLVTPTLTTPPFTIGALQPPAHELVAMEVLGRLHAGGVMRLAGALEKAAKRVFDWIACPPLFNVTGQPAMSVPLAWSAEWAAGRHPLCRSLGDEATLFRLAGSSRRPAVVLAPSTGERGGAGVRVPTAPTLTPDSDPQI